MADAANGTGVSVVGDSALLTSNVISGNADAGVELAGGGSTVVGNSIAFNPGTGVLIPGGR
jgi:parallel beta-helix repeat protein